MIDPLLLSVTKVSTFEDRQPLTNASGFFFSREERLFLAPVARHAIVASCFDLRFQGQGYFLTDARTHRGMSGAPVVLRSSNDEEHRDGFPWMLAGVHSARLDVGTRDLAVDEALGLNCAWFSDILTTLTEPRPP